ncbi:hypothetical protein TNCV_4698681 [Trichonephila clavipes]|nr:hypothetical protein TNCV_4698681 [Trichonephila clavipes]
MPHLHAYMPHCYGSFQTYFTNWSPILFELHFELKPGDLRRYVWRRPGTAVRYSLDCCSQHNPTTRSYGVSGAILFDR